MTAKEKIVLSLGSNLGDRSAHLRNGVKRLKEIGFQVDKISSVYESRPMDGASGDNYLNIIVTGFWNESPMNLLNAAESVEIEEGRKSKGDLSPRPLDIDIIFFGNRIIDEPSLVIPHRRFHKRMFVLKPLCDLDGSLRCPRTGKSVTELMNKLDDDSDIRPAGDLF